MTDTVMILIESGVTVLAAASLYLYLTVNLYPWLILRLSSGISGGRGDRGLRRLTFPEGRATVYEPAPEIRRYIPRYALIKRDGCVYIKCRLHDSLAHIRYDVTAFDRRGRMLDVLSVSERITQRGQTRTVRLPRKTVYVRLTLRLADGMYEDREPIAWYSPLRVGIFAGASVLTAVICGLVMRGSLAGAAEALSLSAQVNGGFLTVVIAAVLGAAGAGWTLYMHYLHCTRVINK